MKRFPDWIAKNPVLPWGFLFLFLNLAVTQYGGINALSRVAAMRAITEGHTLSIDNYQDWTIDWAKSPNGHIYSNKAPGAAFLALPFFAVTEIFSLSLAHSWGHFDEKGRAPQPGYIPHTFVMFFFQLLPCFLLVLCIAGWMIGQGMPVSSAHFFALAAFFGNTAAFYMNCHFGHGIASILFLAAFFHWLERRYVWCGLFLSWALLSDYGVAFALPFFLLATAWRERDLRSEIRIGVGALPGAIVWIWFHWVAFGSPFATANQFTNPEQINTLSHTGTHLWGEYSPLPSMEILGELLFGSSRGLLFTQPWMLAVFILPFFVNKRFPKEAVLLALGSLVGLLWMNGGFGGWHSGWAMGPRYLSVAFPALALAVALAWEKFPRALRLILWAALAVALVFRIFVFPFSNMAPNENLWVYHWGLIFGDHRGTTMLRYGLALVGSAWAIEWWRQRTRNGISISPNPV